MITYLLLAFAAADTPPVGLASFEGCWSAGAVEIAEGATAEMRWSAVLGDRFHRIDYRMDWPGGGFEAVGHYKPLGDDAYEGSWAASNGGLHPIRAEFSDGTLTSRWGRPETEEGRTRYALTSTGEMEVTDWVLTEDGWRRFNHGVYIRSDCD